MSEPEKQALSDEQWDEHPPGLKSALWRGWRKKCPRCGKGPLFIKMLTLHERCSNCGLVYLEDKGDVLGPMIFFDRVLFLIPMVTLYVFIDPHASKLVYFGGGIAMILLLVGTMPNRNGLFLAIDYYTRHVNKI